MNEKQQITKFERKGSKVPKDIICIEFFVQRKKKQIHLSRKIVKTGQLVER